MAKSRHGISAEQLKNGASGNKDYQSLIKAIAAAIEKDDKARGIWVDPNLPKPERQLTTLSTYIARVAIGKGHKTIKDTNYDRFSSVVKAIQFSNPNLHITFSRIDTTVYADTMTTE